MDYHCNQQYDVMLGDICTKDATCIWYLCWNLCWNIKAVVYFSGLMKYIFIRLNKPANTSEMHIYTYALVFFSLNSLFYYISNEYVIKLNKIESLILNLWYILFMYIMVYLIENIFTWSRYKNKKNVIFNMQYNNKYMH